MHDGPLRSCDAPAAFRLFLRQLYGAGTSEIGFEFAAFDKNTAPDDLAGFAYAFQ
jgi:hypothetical protein